MKPNFAILPVACLLLGPAWSTCPQGPTEAVIGSDAPAPPTDLDEAAVIAHSVELLLAMQESYGDEDAPREARAEWPYQGVYRVRGEDGKSVIPDGYRVGGTSIVAWSLLTAPGYGENVAAQDAVARALGFVLEALTTERMASGFAGGYDVRGWGHAYALWFLLQLRALEAVPEGRAGAVDDWVARLVDTLEATEIKYGGGWNYGRRAGFGGKGNQASPFMTGPTLLALFEARRQGQDVDGQVVERALTALIETRVRDGSDDLGDDGFSYGYSRGDRRSRRPGAMGRLCSGETALFLAGRSSAARLRSGVEAFVRHWDQLEVRRRQNRTHIPPYSVAPYYVYFAHYHAALAVSLLPPDERPEWRTKVLGRLFQARLESGGWNDRVFDRSENYGTAMGLLSLTVPLARPLATWSAGGTSDGPSSKR